MSKLSEIRKVVQKTSNQLDNLAKDSDRANPINADLELSLKAMAFTQIKEIILKEE